MKVHVGQTLQLRDFVSEFGQPYSEMLGIELTSKRKGEIVKWFLASILYSKPIRESSATKTYQVFAKNRVTTAKAIVNAGWDRLVQLLDEGGYTRYDFSTADRLLQVFNNLEKLYRGDLRRLYEGSRDGEELEANMKHLGSGIGDTTISIFLRDMRPIWPKANPRPTPLVTVALKQLHIKDLTQYARKHSIDVVRLETALVRYSKNFLKKGKALSIEH
jgi:hypothetical protein